MKPDLAKQLLKIIIEPAYDNDEAEAERIFRDLQFLADYKYDFYEMFAPGRHFLEHLYVWLKQFDFNDRPIALKYVLNDLIFISRNEFELLSKVLYWEIVRRIQFDLASEDSGIERYMVNQISRSNELRTIERSTLYIGMSDGARIDYFRRHHPNIGNEQVLASYHVDQSKCEDMIKELENECGTGSRFRLVFLIDDFCASGSTLIREKENILSGTLSRLEQKHFHIVEPKSIGEKKKNITLLEYLLDPKCICFLCTLLATQKSVDNISLLVPRLSSLLKNLQVEPVAIIDDNRCLKDPDSEIGKICTKYYQKRMEDKHTGDVTFGYKECGLPVVLHHNTPNNSLYILWNRRAVEPDGINKSFEPLFKRIERHKITND